MREDDLMNEGVEIMWGRIGLGMGIDKCNVRWVMD